MSQSVKKASQSSRPQARSFIIIFSEDMRLGKNTSRPDLVPEGRGSGPHPLKEDGFAVFFDKRARDALSGVCCFLLAGLADHFGSRRMVRLPPMLEKLMVKPVILSAVSLPTISSRLMSISISWLPSSRITR